MLQVFYAPVLGLRNPYIQAAGISRHLMRYFQDGIRRCHVRLRPGGGSGVVRLHHTGCPSASERLSRRFLDNGFLRPVARTFLAAFFHAF